MKVIIIFAVLVNFCCGFSQKPATIWGKITTNNKPVSQLNIKINHTSYKTQTDSLGNYIFVNIAPGNYKIQISAMEFQQIIKYVTVKYNENLILNFDLTPSENTINEVVISGTLKPIRRLESPVPVEVYSPAFFKKNPSPSIYEA
ncbi:MAG: carboxypeptidase-like regulatory domain-containing protein, partial [Flavobacterium sp.]|nr:carboxypeptidase-like regulatory domain-containing protein [Flavobacterium sp.]